MQNPGLGMRTKQGSRLYYKTENNMALIFLVVGIVFVMFNWVAFFLCWAISCFMAFNQTAMEVDFDDNQQQVRIRTVGALTSSVKSERAIPYAQVTGVVLQGNGIALTLNDGTSVTVSEEEPAPARDARMHVLSQVVPTLMQPVQPMQPMQPVQPMAPVEQQAYYSQQPVMMEQQVYNPPQPMYAPHEAPVQQQMYQPNPDQNYQPPV